ncbi:MAG: hypothetical protein AAFX06_19000 [Planctomycetota bacterium]
MTDIQVPRSAKTRPLTIVAQDPSVLDRYGKPLLTTVNVPAEELAPGPSGYRVRVVDYDASTGTLYEPLQEGENLGGFKDPHEGRAFDELLVDPRFHQQNVYAIAMRVLGQFETALGRRVSWQFETHQLKIVPHAFREANAFYSRDHEAVLFGYFAVPQQDRKDSKKSHPHDRIYTCLSHDIVAHETTHALLDGIRHRFLYPSAPDQAAFHEGFSDIVALLSVLSVPELVEEVLIRGDNKEVKISTDKNDDEFKSESLRTLRSDIELIAPLVSLADQMGAALGNSSRKALRASLEIKPDKTALKKSEFSEPHRRGELLVAAVMRAVMKIAKRRALSVGVEGKDKDYRRVSAIQLAESYAKAARDVLTICIRGLDYLVPVHVSFQDYLAALLTADYELVGNDSKYGYRQHLLQSFHEYGIGSRSQSSSGVLEQVNSTRWLSNDKTDHYAMMLNPDEMFRYIWENRNPLGISDDYYTRVTSVSPTIRVGPDGAMVSETVVEYVQVAVLRACELHRHGLSRPRSMPVDARLKLYGGGTLIFDVRGKLKYHIRNPLNDPKVQNPIIRHLWDTGQLTSTGAAISPRLSLASLHERRELASPPASTGGESWP